MTEREDGRKKTEEMNAHKEDHFHLSTRAAHCKFLAVMTISLFGVADTSSGNQSSSARLPESNLVANNFTVESSNNSVLPLGLRCLQRNFPCNRNSPVYYNFSIKCSGPQITSNNQIIYERDNETVGPASYYVTSENRWAVSSVGLFIDSSQPQYRSFSSSQFTQTLDPELFRQHEYLLDH